MENSPSLKLADKDVLMTEPQNTKSTTYFRPYSTKQYSDYCIKLLLLGDSNVGKSSLLTRFVDGSFSSSLMGNAGIDVKTKHIDLNSKRIKLEIWDTAGHERFRTITGQYYKGAMGIILVYDVSERRSFENLEDWMEQIEKESDSLVVKLLVGNKTDLKRLVSTEEGLALSHRYGVSFIETSAKNDNNVEESFLQVAGMILKDPKILMKAAENGRSNSQTVSLQGSRNQNAHSKGKCC